MSLRTWSLWAVLAAGIAWIAVVLGIVLPLVMRWLGARHRGGAPSGAWSGIGFLPRELVLGVLAALVPPLLLLLAWAWARRPGAP